MHLVLTSYEGNSLQRMCKRTLHKTPDKLIKRKILVDTMVFDNMLHIYV